MADDFGVRSSDFAHGLAVVRVTEDDGRLHKRCLVGREHGCGVVDELTALAVQESQ